MSKYTKGTSLLAFRVALKKRNTCVVASITQEHLLAIGENWKTDLIRPPIMETDLIRPPIII
jgi:hypothetical protein